MFHCLVNSYQYLINTKFTRQLLQVVCDVMDGKFDYEPGGNPDSYLYFRCLPPQTTKLYVLHIYN
jgi:hypothetical protein